MARDRRDRGTPRSRGISSLFGGADTSPPGRNPTGTPTTSGWAGWGFGGGNARRGPTRTSGRSGRNPKRGGGKKK